MVHRRNRQKTAGVVKRSLRIITTITFLSGVLATAAMPNHLRDR
jgi:hypothetical protein